MLQHQTAWYSRMQIAMAGGLAIALLAFYALGFRPATQTLADLRHQIADQKLQLTTSKMRASDLPAVSAEVDKLRVKLERFDKRLPRQPELSKFINQITSLSHQDSLRKLNWQPGPVQRGELFSALPIAISFEGDFMNVFSFLRDAEAMQRLTRVKNAEIRVVPAQAGQVNVQLTMDIYFAEGG